jgi:hypothetical protein
MTFCRVKKLQKLTEGEPYTPGPGEYVITEENSFEEILFHILSEIAGTPTDRLSELEAIVESCSCMDLEDYLGKDHLGL